MKQEFFSVEDYLAQRGRMKLLDAVVIVDAKGAAARSVASEKWPLFDGTGISPVVIVELVAQTAGIKIRWDEMQRNQDPEKKGGGLIVGVKDAVFHVSSIPVDSTIITSAEKQYVYMEYAEYYGFSKTGGEIIGEARIQVLRTD